MTMEAERIELMLYRAHEIEATDVAPHVDGIPDRGRCVEDDAGSAAGDHRGTQRCDDIGDLVQRKIVSGGMVLKLEAAKRALEGGVRGVHIVGGTVVDGLLAAVRAAQTKSPVPAHAIPGTRILREPIAIGVPAALSAA